MRTPTNKPGYPLYEMRKFQKEITTQDKAWESLQLRLKINRMWGLWEKYLKRIGVKYGV